MTYQWQALVLRILMQLLIKAQAGSTWGMSGNEVLELNQEANRWIADASLATPPKDGG